MTLNDYFQRDDAFSLTALSVAVGVTKGRLSQLRDSDALPPDLALSIERETGGIFNASDVSETVRNARKIMEKSA